jgi:hypothetical protein
MSTSFINNSTLAPRCWFLTGRSVPRSSSHRRCRSGQECAKEQQQPPGATPACSSTTRRPCLLTSTPSVASSHPSRYNLTNPPPRLPNVRSLLQRPLLCPSRSPTAVRNNHAMDMSLCHGGVLVEHECVCESRRVHVRRVGACRTIVESGHEREFVPPQPLVVWG